MDFRVLGPLEVWNDHGQVEIRRGLPRLLLLVLIMRVGEIVTPDALGEILWGSEQPVNPQNALQTQISYLRRALGDRSGDPQVIVTRPGGYLLDASPDSVDAVRFQRALHRAGRLADSRTKSSAAAALAELDGALAMWRGEAFADAAGLEFVVSEATRLHEAQLAALEARAECLLELGRHRDASVELHSLTLAHPLRERLYELLAVAQYRCGRQAEALETYDRARAVLVDELGVEPGPGLQRTQRLLLEQSAELDWTPPPDGAPPASTSTASPASPTGRRASLPAPVSRLIGRDTDVARVRQLFEKSRIVTVTGPGGAGKTSLALEVARGSPEATEVWFVDLDGVASDDLVPLTIALALGTATNPDADAVQVLAQTIGDRAALLVLDTCEHVVNGAARVVSGLLARCPALQVLATSRRPLAVRGELAWPIPPLAVPMAERALDEIARVAAVELFVERAIAVKPDFVITADNAQDVARICAALDGLPLAIELAAARMDMLSASAIRARLSDRFALLVDGDRDAAARQRTLRSTVDWSFNLLSDEERRLFVLLSVFAGPFGLDEVAALADPGRGDPVLLLSGLIRQSMVSVVGAERYQLLDTPREYGRGLLASDPDANEIRDRHARHYVVLAERYADGIRSTDQAHYVGRARADLPDLRAAIEWGFSRGQPELAARIVGALSWFFMLEGMSTESMAYLDRADQSAADLSRFARARIAYGRALLAAPLGRLAEARTAGEMSVQLARQDADATGAALGLAALSVAEWALGDLATAAAHQDEALELLDESVEPRLYANILGIRARTAIDLGEPAARQMLDKVIASTERSNDLHTRGLAKAQLSLLDYSDGRFAEALVAASDALRWHDTLNEREATAGALHLVGRAELALGHLDRARISHLRALEIATTTGHPGATCEAIEDLARVAAAGDQLEVAIELINAVDHQRTRLGLRRRPLEQALFERLRDDIRAPGTADADTGSPALDLEEAAALARASVEAAPQQRSSTS